MRTLIFLIGFSVFLSSCKREDDHYYLRGAAYHGDDQIPMADVQLTMYKQVLQNGIFGGSFSPATSGYSASNGIYNLAWKRENFAALKLVAEREQYVTREFVLDVNDFTAGDALLKNIDMYPEAFVSVRILNSGLTASTDQCSFTFVNAIFDCACCSNGWKIFHGAAVDSTFSCRLYGNRWLKYQRSLNTAEADTMLVDSIWCPAFETTQVLLVH
jgi:hypothetical protein